MTKSRLKVRRHGAAVTHYADIPATNVHPDTVAGKDCRTVALPVAALCGSVLGVVGPAPVVVMEGERWPVGCRACMTLADTSGQVAEVAR